MSSAVATSRRTVRFDSVADGQWTPATCSGAVSPTRSDAISRSSWGTMRAAARSTPPSSTATPRRTSSSPFPPRARSTVAASTGRSSTSRRTSVATADGASASRRSCTATSKLCESSSAPAPSAERTAAPVNPASSNAALSAATSAADPEGGAGGTAVCPARVDTTIRPATASDRWRCRSRRRSDRRSRSRSCEVQADSFGRTIVLAVRARHLEARDEHVGHLDLQEVRAHVPCGIGAASGLPHAQSRRGDVLPGRTSRARPAATTCRTAARSGDPGTTPSRPAAATGGGADRGVADAPGERLDLDPARAGLVLALTVDPVEFEEHVHRPYVTPPCREGSG